MSSTKLKIPKNLLKNSKIIVPLDSNSKLVSSDMSSLFTSIPLDFTKDVILQQIYSGKEIVTNITPNELKELVFAHKCIFFF